MNSFDSEEASEEGTILEDSREHFEASKDSNRSSEKQPTRRKADESEVQPTRKRANESPYGKHIYLNKKDNKYVVTAPNALTNDGKPKYLGYYTTLEEAKRVRDEFIANAKVGKYHEPTTKRANESPYGKYISLNKRILNLTRNHIYLNPNLQKHKMILKTKKHYYLTKFQV